MKVGQDRQEILVFEIGGRRFGLPPAEVRELLRAVAIEPLPGAPRAVEGVINLRGRVIRVYNLRARLGLPEKPLEPADHLLVFGRGEGLAALRIDRAIELVNALVDDVASDQAGPGVTRVARLGDGLVPILDNLADLLDAREDRQ